MAGLMQDRMIESAARGGLSFGERPVLLLVPLIAMQFTDQVAWDAVDFAVFGVMLVAAFGTYEIAARVTGNSFYRAAAGIAIATVFFLLWLQLAVGLVQD